MNYEIPARSDWLLRPQKTRRVIDQVYGRAWFETSDPRVLVIRYLDESDGLVGLSSIQNRFNELLYTRLGELGIEHHFIRRLNMREQLVFWTEPFSFSIQVYNSAIGEFAQRFQIPEGSVLSKAVFELVIPSSSGEDVAVSSDHLVALNWIDEDDLKESFRQTQRINDCIQGQGLALGIRFASYRIQFGYCARDPWDQNRILLTDSFDLRRSYLIDTQTDVLLHPARGEEGASYASCSGIHQIARCFGII